MAEVSSYHFSSLDCPHTRLLIFMQMYSTHGVQVFSSMRVYRVGTYVRAERGAAHVSYVVYI